VLIALWTVVSAAGLRSWHRRRVVDRADDQLRALLLVGVAKARPAAVVIPAPRTAEPDLVRPAAGFPSLT